MIRVGVIGAGAWGINHVRVVATEPECTLAAVADTSPEARARVRSVAPTAACTGDPDRLISDPDIDAVVIASPAAAHARLACAALNAGKHVLVEKPLALNITDALAVERAAVQSGRVGMVGHLMVFHPAVLRLQELLHSGALGKLHYAHSSRVNLGRLRHDENALWSFGPHDLSMLDLLIRQLPKSVTARGQCVLQPGIEDVVFLTLRYGSGEMAHVQLSWLSPRKERRLTLVCSQKMAEFDDTAADKLRIYDKGYDRPPTFSEYGEYLTLRDGDVHIPRLAMQEPLRLQLKHFLACCSTGETPTPDLASGVRSVRVLCAAQQSLAADGAVVQLDNS